MTNSQSPDMGANKPLFAWVTNEDKCEMAWGLWMASMTGIAAWTKEWLLVALIPAFPLIVAFGFMLARGQRKAEGPTHDADRN